MGLGVSSPLIFFRIDSTTLFYRYYNNLFISLGWLFLHMERETEVLSLNLTYYLRRGYCSKKR